MAARLRIGVIGLGRNWSRYRTALLALRPEVRVRAVHDPSSAIAHEEARQLKCESCASVIELTERDDIDAILLNGGLWHGLWPVEQAAHAGKPVLCTGSLLRDDEHADEMATKLASAWVQMSVWPAFELLSEAMTPLVESLGTPRLALGGRIMAAEGDPLDSAGTLALLQVVAAMFGSEPAQIQAVSPTGQPNYVNVMLEFEGGVGQLSLSSGPAAVSRTWLDVDAEGGTLRAALPRSLTWQDIEGRHSLEVPGGLAEVWLLDRFIHSVRASEPPTCSFAQAYQALTWLRAARKSRSEGGVVRLG